MWHNMVLISILLSLQVVWTSDIVTDPFYDSTAVSREDPWDIDGPCQVYVERLSVALGKIVQCAANYTIPPKVCTNCIEEYILFRQVEYDTKNLKNIFTLDNTSCSDVIYQNYLLSYVNELSQSVNERIWDISRCESCISISWNFTHNSSDYSYDPNVFTFKSKLDLWRKCISNYSDFDGSLIEQNNTMICDNCNDLFSDLFAFYWDVYTKPGIQFCVDVETTMNDTVRLWNNVWKCSTTKDRKQDATLVAVTAGVLILFTTFFYLSSFIQGGGEARRFIQYSRMTDPRPDRQRLLSTSDLTSRGSRSNLSAGSGSARVHGTPRRRE